MLDTVRLAFPIHLHNSQLDGWKRHTIKIGDLVVKEWWYYNSKLPSAYGGGAFLVKCNFYPDAYSKVPLVILELSVAKAMYGNNFMMFMDIASGISRINSLLGTDPKIPLVDVGTGKLIRADFCYNHVVKGEVVDYILALGTLPYPSRDTKHYRYDGVTFSCKDSHSVFYNKFQECRNALAFGLLRQESQLCTPEAISRLLGIEKLFLADVTTEIAAQALETDLKRLRINDRFFSSKSEVLHQLTEAFPRRAAKMYGILLGVAELGKKELLATGAVNERTLNRALADAYAAKISLPRLQGTESLPPLEIKFW